MTQASSEREQSCEHLIGLLPVDKRSKHGD